MRKPNANERRLLALFGLMIFAFLNIVLVRWYSNQRLALGAEIAALEDRTREARALLGERAHWESRQRWMLAHPLETHQGQDSDSRFAEDIQRSLAETGLSIDSQQLKEAVPKGGLVEAQFEFSIKGRLEQIVRWLTRVQQPGNHLVIETLTLRQVEGEGMSAQVRIGKVFRVGEVAQNR